jgi:hypothetical protein
LRSPYHQVAFEAGLDPVFYLFARFLRYTNGWFNLVALLRKFYNIALAIMFNSFIISAVELLRRF